MRCTNPNILQWYRSDLALDHKGEKPIFYGSLRKFGDDFVKHMIDFNNGRSPLVYYVVPCGHCQACSLNRSQEWSVRCQHEARYYRRNCFITLTCNDDYIDKIFPDGSLTYEPFQLFMKRFRRSLEGVNLRFFMCGEYGSDFNRPHYHALIFGYDFPDRKLFLRSGPPMFYSPFLARLWSDPDTKDSYGFHTIGALTKETCDYVARYVCKKQYGDRHVYQGRTPEFCHMSLKPGIGSLYCDTFSGYDFHKYDMVSGDWYDDFLEYRDSRIKIPRYYDKRFEKFHNADFVSLKKYRLDHADFDLAEQSFKRHEDYLKCVTMSHNFKGDRNV